MCLFSQSLMLVMLGQSIAHASPNLAGYGNDVNESRSQCSVPIDVAQSPPSYKKAGSPFMLIPIQVGPLGALAHESGAAPGLTKTNSQANSRRARA